MPATMPATEIAPLPIERPRALNQDFAQQNELASLPSRPVESPQWQRSDLPSRPKTPTGEIQQPESIQLSVLPEHIAYHNVYQTPARQSQSVSHASPPRIRMPDSILPEGRLDRGAVPICSQRPINEAKVAEENSPRPNSQVPDSGLPAARMATLERLQQPEYVR